jgi:hypothetical protein
MTNDCIDVCNAVIGMLPDDVAPTDSGGHDEILDALARCRPIPETKDVVMSLERGTVTEVGGYLSLRANGTEIGWFCLEARHSTSWSGRETTRRGEMTRRGEITRRKNAAVTCHPGFPFAWGRRCVPIADLRRWLGAIGAADDELVAVARELGWPDDIIDEGLPPANSPCNR